MNAILRLFFRKIILIYLACSVPYFLGAIIPNNFVDPTPTFHIAGPTPSIAQKKSFLKDAPLVSFNLSAYTQITKSAYNADRSETKLGNRAGNWGMGSMALGLVANPNEANPNLRVPIFGDKADFPQFWDRVLDAYTDLQTVRFGLGVDSFYSVDFNFEKIGLRTEISTEPVSGVIFSIQGGICDQNASTPIFLDPSKQTDTPYDEESSDSIISHFMKVGPRTIILEELGIDVSGYQAIKLDDISAQLVLYHPFALNDEKSRLSLNFIPRITGGLIIPADRLAHSKKSATDSESNVLKQFIPVGNDGFLGLMCEAGASFDFKDTINFGVFAGYTIFKSRSITGYRVPNNRYQVALYPFTQNVTKKRGATWHITASMYADGFLDSMECFADYTWIVHKKDTITLDDANNLPVFEDGLISLERQSEFRAGTLHIGLSYRPATNLRIGTSFQAVLYGTQVYKPYIFMASFGFLF